MVETITPVVHGGSRTRWIASLVLHVTGSTLSAAALGAALGAAGLALGAPWGMASVLLVAAVAALYLARELGVAVPIPEMRRQVPEWWRTFFPPPLASFLYGVGLGPGFFTYLTHGTFVVVGVTAVATGDPLRGALLAGAFGLARGLAPIVAVDVRTPAAGAALVERLARSASKARWRIANGIVLATVVVVEVFRLGAFDGVGEVGAVAAGGISLVMGAAAVSKLVRARAWRRSVRSYAFPEPLEHLVVVGVPFVEIAIAALPFVGMASTAGLLTIAVMIAFSAAIVLARLRVGPRVECGCFGASATRDYRALLGRNAGIAALGVVAWRGSTDSPAFRSLGSPTGGDLLPAALTVVGIAVAIWVVTVVVREAVRGSVR